MMMTNRFIKIGAAAELLGVSIDTLRKWELSGELIPDRKSQAGTRFYDSSKLINLGDGDSPTICYQDLRSTAIYGTKNYHFQDIATIHSAVA